MRRHPRPLVYPKFYRRPLPCGGAYFIQKGGWLRGKGEGPRGWREPSSRVSISRVLYPLRGDDHLSGPVVTDRLKRPTRISSSCGPQPVLADGFLLGLAPDEVYRAIPVTRNAVSSYLAISPLPCSGLRLNLAVCFLLHCLSRFRAWTLSSILPCGARTFLQHCCRRPSATRTQN